MGSVTTAPQGVNSVATLTALYEMGHGPLPDSPSRVGRYQIRDQLGAGAMGVVYRAHDPDLGRDVAIKVIRPSAAGSEESGADFEKRFLQEARSAASLSHPGIVVVHDVGRDP